MKPTQQFRPEEFDRLDEDAALKKALMVLREEKESLNWPIIGFGVTLLMFWSWIGWQLFRWMGR